MTRATQNMSSSMSLRSTVVGTVVSWADSSTHRHEPEVLPHKPGLGLVQSHSSKRPADSLRCETCGKQYKVMGHLRNHQRDCTGQNLTSILKAARTMWQSRKRRRLNLQGDSISRRDEIRSIGQEESSEVDNQMVSSVPFVIVTSVSSHCVRPPRMPLRRHLLCQPPLLPSSPLHPSLQFRKLLPTVQPQVPLLPLPPNVHRRLVLLRLGNREEKFDFHLALKTGSQRIWPRSTLKKIVT